MRNPDWYLNLKYTPNSRRLLVIQREPVIAEAVELPGPPE